MMKTHVLNDEVVKYFRRFDENIKLRSHVLHFGLPPHVTKLNTEFLENAFQIKLTGKNARKTFGKRSEKARVDGKLISKRNVITSFLR